MTAEPALSPPASGQSFEAADHRGSPIPTAAMVATRLMELRRRRGLMATLVLVTVGVPAVFLLVRLVLHAIAPKTYGPAGGYDIFTGLTAGLLYVFGFIVAAALGCTAGSVDLSDGMFRHLVVTGRSRLALYLARIPAGLAIIVPLVAIGYTVVCVVCATAAPDTTSYGGLNVPVGMSKPQLEAWASANATKVICDVPYTGNIGNNVAAVCGNTGPVPPAKQGPGRANPHPASSADLRRTAIKIADRNYADYRTRFAVPPDSLMIKAGLWLELEAAIGFLVGLGLGSLLGQRTVGVILMVVLEVVLTPIVIRTRIPHLENLQRAVVGVATAHLEPGQLPLAFGGGGHDYRLTESTTTAVLVIVAWLIGWTSVGAWRMMTRDA
jgi:hypothetical protein